MEPNLYFGDCLQYMKSMRAQSVDFCFTDPPYNVKKDYGDYKDNLTDEEYLAWSAEIITEIKRVARAACIYVPQKYIRSWWGMLGDDYRQIILSYSPEGAIRWGFINQFSSLLVNAKPIGRVKNVWHNCQMTGLGYFFKEDNFDHPGYTSEDITGRAINAFTLPGQIVFDPFSGTGTTMIMCHKMGREFVGCERERRWHDLSIRRMHDAAQHVLLPGM